MIEYYKAVLVPTNKITENCVVNCNGKFKVANRETLGNNIFNVGVYQNTKPEVQFYHLYQAINTNRFENGDVVYNSKSDCISVFNGTKSEYAKNNLSLVVAATDDSYDLPRVDTQFLSNYVKYHNGE
ncbi:MAG: hypothetical protein FWC41_09010 [Firmicutes bacterium]|nr:hypothetical protein [Bacillota bacterium]